MSRTVWKHALLPGNDLAVHGWPDIVHVGPATPGEDAPAVWIEQDPASDEIVTIRVQVVGTGHPLPDGPSRHIGSAWCGAFMWHVYELLS